MNFKKHLETTWHTMLEHIAILILMTLVTIVVSFLTIGILAPVVMAGFVQAIVLLMQDGRQPRIEDLFSQMRLFLPLLGFTAVVALATLIGFVMLILPGVAILLAVTFGCIYMIPLMTDQNMGLIDAVKYSWKMALDDNLADHLVVVILFVGLISIGSSVFVGILVTQPFAIIFLISVYLEKKNATRAVNAVSQPSPPPDNNL